MEWKYGELPKTVEIDEIPKRLKKITGTRFASVLGLNPYQSPFGAWCEILGLVKLPFEDNKYTIAGKTIEPKQIEYVASIFPNILTPEQYYGAIYQDKKYDFYNDKKIFGGMWDLVSTRKDKVTKAMIGECKTSSKPQDWQNNNVPVYYLCQGMLYVFLDNLPEILFIASFLQEMDYAHPENYKVDAENTVLIVKQLKDTFITINGENLYIEDLVQRGMDFWKNHVLTGISPEFDEIKDKEYLALLRAGKPQNDSTLEAMVESAKNKLIAIDTLKKTSGLDTMEKELKKLEENIKSTMLELLNEKELSTSCGIYNLKGTMKKKFNEKVFQEENEKLYDKYSEETISYTLSKKLEKEKGEK